MIYKSKIFQCVKVCVCVHACMRACVQECVYMCFKFHIIAILPASKVANDYCKCHNINAAIG